MEKENVSRKVYYNEDGFGSIYETYKEAETIKQYNHWWCPKMVRKQKGIQTKPYQGFNSYVADEPLEAIQIDLDLISASVNSLAAAKWK